MNHWHHVWSFFLTHVKSKFFYHFTRVQISEITKFEWESHLHHRQLSPNGCLKKYITFLSNLWLHPMTQWLFSLCFRFWKWFFVYWMSKNIRQVWATCNVYCNKKNIYIFDTINNLNFDRFSKYCYRRTR